MEDTWGISGPDFTGIYLISLLTALLFAFAIRILTRSGVAGAPAAHEALSAQELACLTGGPRRVVEAAVAQLVDTGQLRTSRDGYLQATTKATGSDPVERTVLADVRRHGRRSVSMLTYRLSVSDAVGEVAGRLVRAGYLVDQGLAARRKTIGMIPLLAVFAVGTVRWLAGVANDRPIGWLTVLLIGTGVTLYSLHRQTTCPRTFRGVNATRHVLAVTPAESVAAGGLDSHPDHTIRQSLLGSSAHRHTAYRDSTITTGGAWLAGGGSVGAGGGSCGASGGSSCGGGGCGG
jgi:uncharacterized protein (TIGR04222 family)